MTSTDICNMALGMIGHSEIADIEDDNDTARKCRIFYDPTRRACLRDHKWNFAVARSAALAENDDAPPFGWLHSFKLPTDPESIRVLQLNGCDDSCWTVEGKNLLTNQTTAKILYIYDAPADQWDSLFVDMFVLLLASKLAAAVAHDAGYSQQLLKSYMQRIEDAKAVDGQEQGNQDTLRVPDLTTDVRNTDSLNWNIWPK
jgi:hypothetical protein